MPYFGVGPYPNKCALPSVRNYSYKTHTFVRFAVVGFALGEEIRYEGTPQPHSPSHVPQGPPVSSRIANTTVGGINPSKVHRVRSGIRGDIRPTFHLLDPAWVGGYPTIRRMPRRGRTRTVPRASPTFVATFRPFTPPTESCSRFVIGLPSMFDVSHRESFGEITSRYTDEEIHLPPQQIMSHKK